MRQVSKTSDNESPAHNLAFNVALPRIFQQKFQAPPSPALLEVIRIWFQWSPAMVTMKNARLSLNNALIVGVKDSGWDHELFSFWGARKRSHFSNSTATKVKTPMPKM